MNDWLQKHIDDNFREFQGLSITGRIPVKDKLVNEALAEALQGMAAAPAPSSPGPDLRRLLTLVKKAEVHAVEGAIVVDIQIAV